MNDGAGQQRSGRRIRALLGWTAALAGVAVLAAGFVVGYQALYRALYSPEAYALRYMHLLEQHHAADALQLPGVSFTPDVLAEHRISPEASDVLLRSAALGDVSDVHVVSSATDSGVTDVTIEYTAAGKQAQTTLLVERDGWDGLAPAWRFAEPPLSMISLTVAGSETFQVNGFPLDKRQVAPEGVEANLAAPVHMLVFSPGAYTVTVDSGIAHSDGTTIIADEPLEPIDVRIDSDPTTGFTKTVQKSVDKFLNACAEQEVLQPTGCPFGFRLENRIDGVPAWSMTDMPEIELLPSGNDWVIPRTKAVAHIRVNERSLYDGSVTEVTADVPFFITGSAKLLPDDTVAISISSPDTD